MKAYEVYSENNDSKVVVRCKECNSEDFRIILMREPKSIDDARYIDFVCSRCGEVYRHSEAVRKGIAKRIMVLANKN